MDDTVVLEKVLAHFQSGDLAAGKKYARDRGVSAQAFRELELGYLGEDLQPLKEVLSTRDVGVARTLGLVDRHSRDRFQERLIFPLRDEYGRLIGLTGRAIGDGEPRYLTTKASSVRSTGQILYGLFYARDHAQRLGEIILVEGPMDFAVMWSVGVRNVAASLGTSLSPRQRLVLCRSTKSVSILFDEPTDDDPEKRKEKSKRMADLIQAIAGACSALGTTCKRVRLPDGEDPASFFRKKRKLS